MRSTLIILCSAVTTVITAQGLDVRNGLPNWGVDTIQQHYLPDWQGTHLPTEGIQWTWDLDSIGFVFEGEVIDTVWHHSEHIPPSAGGAFSVFSMRNQRYTFYHLNADTLVEDSAWAFLQGTTEIGHPAVPLCWQAQHLGDTLWYFEQLAGLQRMTTYRAHLSLRTPWMPWTELLVFEDRVLDFIIYRIHRREDLVREVARYVVGDGLYLMWPSGIERSR